MMMLDLQKFAKGSSGADGLAADGGPAKVNKRVFTSGGGSSGGGGSGSKSSSSGSTRSSSGANVTRAEIKRDETYDLIRERNGREIKVGTITGAELIAQGYSYRPADNNWRDRNSQRYKVRRR